jgi:hypothetical protein
VDHRSTKNSRGTKEILDHFDSTQATTPSYVWLAGKRFAAIYLLHDSRGKHRVSSREGRRRARIPIATSSLLHQRSPWTLKDKVPQVQKLLYAVLLTALKLRYYFDDHKVIVVMRFPIGDILHNKEAVGRAKWACKLGAHDIESRSRTTMLGDALLAADCESRLVP